MNWVGAIGEEFGSAKADETENGATFSGAARTEVLYRYAGKYVS